MSYLASSIPWLQRTWLCFYQAGSAWSMDQGSNKNHSPAYNFAPTVTKFCVVWEGLSVPRDTKFGNCRCEIVDSRAFPSWSLIHGLPWSGLIKAEPGDAWSQGIDIHATDLDITEYYRFCIKVLTPFGPHLNWFLAFLSQLIHNMTRINFTHSSTTSLRCRLLHSPNLHNTNSLKTVQGKCESF